MASPMQSRWRTSAISARPPTAITKRSPAFGATRETYVGLSAHWASQGYVVFRVAHADSGRMQTGGVEQSWSDQTPTDWRNRVRDITMLIDSLDRVSSVSM